MSFIYLCIATLWFVQTLTRCRKIAWSKQGCIAYISQDTLRVNLRHLECRPSDGKWVLSDDTPLHPVAEAHGGQPLVHLCWNEIGSELAVVDSSGRVSIYNIAISLNSLAGQRQAAFDPVDDATQIVGMMWLNIQRSVSAHFGVSPMFGMALNSLQGSCFQCSSDGTRTPGIFAISTPPNRSLSPSWESRFVMCHQIWHH